MEHLKLRVALAVRQRRLHLLGQRPHPPPITHHPRRHAEFTDQRVHHAIRALCDDKPPRLDRLHMKATKARRPLIGLLREFINNQAAGPKRRQVNERLRGFRVKHGLQPPLQRPITRLLVPFPNRVHRVVAWRLHAVGHPAV